MVNIQQRQVITVDVRKSHLGLVRLLLHLIRTHKTLRDFKRSKERQEKKWTQQQVAQSGMAIGFRKENSNFKAIHTSVKSIKHCQTKVRRR